MVGSQTKLKAWDERYSLSDVRGIRLLAAALYHAERLTELRRGLQSEVGYWRSVLGALEASPAEIEAGFQAVISDFIFDPADLWEHQAIAMFVVEGRHEYWPDFDLLSPICRNADIRPQLEALGLICEKHFQWHMAPVNDKPQLNTGFPRTIEHFHWCNYLAQACEPPPPPYRPKGSGYRDDAHTAANFAWALLHRADKDGRNMTISEAVRQAVLRFEVAAPTPELTQPAAARRLHGIILASSAQQAEKRVRKLLEEQIEREPPWAMPRPLTPWDA